jgi:hypothetical protein
MQVPGILVDFDETHFRAKIDRLTLNITVRLSGNLKNNWNKNPIPITQKTRMSKRINECVRNAYDQDVTQGRNFNWPKKLSRFEIRGHSPIDFGKKQF